MSKNYVEPVVDINKFLTETVQDNDFDELQSIEYPWGDDESEDMWG